MTMVYCYEICSMFHHHLCVTPSGVVLPALFNTVIGEGMFSNLADVVVFEVCLLPPHHWATNIADDDIGEVGVQLPTPSAVWKMLR